MLAHVSKWGNSLALRIPNAFAKEISIEEGGSVEINVLDGKMVITPIDPVPAYDINQLIALMTEDNTHEEVDWGEPRGNEVW